MSEDDAPTLQASTAPRERASGPLAFDDNRYDLGDVIGRGGMGEVRLARDTRIDREVAVKLMKQGQGRDTIARFVREARVQGSLDHPAVVPVHDLGIDADGNPYFVMKRLTGTTLHDVLASRDAKRWPRRLLLSRFVDICLAIDFAHTRSVVHRDIKPANLVLGDFGETYVLDWGLARIENDTSPFSKINTVSGDDGHTAVGEMLGTPGYMPPEQIRGELVDAKADVFGLGCVLYEILAGEPALPRGLAAVDATLAAPHHRPSEHHEIPPELDDLCVHATSANAAARPTARQLAEGIQAYLDGDRDVERRRELATEHVRRAETAFAESGDEARAIAMREAGRALVLDPENAFAKDVLTHLMLDAPSAIPAAALAAADAERSNTRQRVIRFGSRAYFGLALALCVMFLLPLNHAWPVVAAVGFCLFTSACLYLTSRKPMPLAHPMFMVMLVLNCVLLVLSGVMFGALLIFPMLLTGSLAAWISQPALYRPWSVVALHVLAGVVVFGLELFGVLPSTFHNEHGSLVLSSWVLDLTPFTAATILVLGIGSQIVNTTIVFVIYRRAQEQAQNDIHNQRWHLQQVLPSRAPGGSGTPSRPPH